MNNKIATLFILIVLSVSSCCNVKYNGKLIDDGNNNVGYYEGNEFHNSNV